MARNHLQGFLTDISIINPNHRVATSSLKRLIEHLQRTVANPVSMTAAQALQLCRNPNSNRLDKYRPAIDRLVRVWGKGGAWPYPGLRHGDEIKEETIKRICFRGDDRAPAEIFRAGFSKRAAHLHRKPQYRGQQVDYSPDHFRPAMKGFSRAGDLDPDSAVCVTPDMNVAALFPLPTSMQRVASESWIYVVYVETGYNTSGRQVLDALAGLSQLSDLGGNEAPIPGLSPAQRYKGRVDIIMQNLYGREMAASVFRPDQIWGAFRIRRSWAMTKFANEFIPNTTQMKKVATGADYKAGGTYEIQDWSPNPAAKYPSAAYQSVVEAFVGETLPSAEVAARTRRMSTTADGFAPSLQV